MFGAITKPVKVAYTGPVRILYRGFILAPNRAYIGPIQGLYALHVLDSKGAVMAYCKNPVQDIAYRTITEPVQVANTGPVLNWCANVQVPLSFLYGFCTGYRHACVCRP